MFSANAKCYIPLKNRSKCMWCNSEYDRGKIEDDICEECVKSTPLKELLLKVTYKYVGAEHDGYCSGGYNYIYHHVYYYDIIELPPDFEYWMVSKDLTFNNVYPESITKKYNAEYAGDEDIDEVRTCPDWCGVRTKVLKKVEIVHFDKYKEKLNTRAKLKSKSVSGDY